MSLCCARGYTPFMERAKGRGKTRVLVIANIQALMIERGLKAPELARKAGLGPTGIYDIFSGKSGSPTVDTVEKIAKALGVTAVRMFMTPQDDVLFRQIALIFPQLPEEDRRRLVQTAEAWLPSKPE